MLQEMPKAGYLCEEVGRMAGLRPKSIFAAIKRGDVSTYKDNLGNLRISQDEAYRYLYTRELAGK